MTFDDAFVLVHGIEGAYTADPQDKGNWTGGKAGAGDLRGTKFGVSAAAYPTLDIKNLTVDQAKAIAKKDYWDRVGGDKIPVVIAAALFDAAYNHGVAGALELTQEALKIPADGLLGPNTIAALNRVDVKQFARQFAIMRVVLYSGLPTWPVYRNGWIGRVLDIYRNMLIG